jgi:predicted GIY-YIG superfamily endonuclease
VDINIKKIEVSMVERDKQGAVWTVYVLLCNNRKLFAGVTKNVIRRLKEQFALGSKTSKKLLRNKPLSCIKKYRYTVKENAIAKTNFINSLKGRERQSFIVQSCIKKPSPPVLTEIEEGKYNIECPMCKTITKLNCDSSRLAIELIRYKCIHETIKEEIDALFEQAILGATCFHNGQFMFQGKDSDRGRDFVLGFSDRGHRKRTLGGYMLMQEISFRNSYLLLGAILEEVFCLISKHLESPSFNDMGSKSKLPKQYKRTTFKEIKQIKFSREVRFLDLAHCTQLIANILKHTGGIIENKESGRDLINKFASSKLVNEGEDIVLMREFIKIGNVPISDLLFVITRLYVCMIDLAAEIFNFEHFRLTNIQGNKIIKNIVNYDIRKEFITYLKSIKDGSRMFMNLD